MGKFITILRGINVSGQKLIKMADLKKELEVIGFTDIKTYIQSGNSVFESDKPPERIDLLIEENYGFRPEILMLSEKEFLQLVSGNPYSSAIGKQIHFFFCKNTPHANVEKLDELKSETEQYLINGKVLYLFASDGIGRSKLAANIEKCLGVPVTGRNLNTVNKLIEMLESN